MTKYLELSERIWFSFNKYFARMVQFNSILARISTIGFDVLVLKENALIHSLLF